MSREYSTNPRFEDNGDIGSCDTYSDVTKNKVTAIISEKVGMSTDHSSSVSTETNRLNGKNNESPTTKLLCGSRSRSNSMDASRTARSTNKPNELETCLPHERSPALDDIEDKSVRLSLVDPSLGNDVSVNKQQFKMEKPPIKQNSSRPVPKDSQFNSCEDDSTNDEQNCLLNGSSNASTPPSSSLKSPSFSPMLPTCTGQPQTIDSEEAISKSPCSTASITSHDSKIPKLMDVQISSLSFCKKSANKDSTDVVKGFSSSEIVDDTGCVLSLDLSQGNQNQYLLNKNATTTNDDESDPIGDDDDASTCLASKPESTTSRSLAAKYVNSLTMANMSDYLNQQFIANSNDDTITDLAAVASFNDSSLDVSANLPAKTSHLQNGQNDDSLEKKTDEEIKEDAPKNDNNQRDEKSLPTVINRSNFVSLTNQYFTSTNNTDAFSTLKNLNDTAINDVAISVNADKSCNATDATNDTLNRATAVTHNDVSSQDCVLSCKVNDREIGANPPSAMFQDVVAPITTVDAELHAENGAKSDDINGTFDNAADATGHSNLMEKPGSSKDVGSNASYTNGSSNDNLWPGNKTMNGAPAYLSKMMDNVSLLRSNNHDIINDDKLKTITTSYNGAKHSLSKDVKICQMAAKSISYKGSRRGAGWGTPRGLGLRGGGETSIANGASGWGPPPQPNTSMARGWGQPPATNSPTSTGASAWGNASGTASSSTDETNNGSINKAPGAVPSGVISSNASQAPGGPTTQNSAPPPSWAAAAGKGLPNNDNASNSGSGQPGSGPTQSTTSKHLESLQSVREALFSQDGWGGDNVKQDNAWDIDGKSSAAAVAPVPETPQGAAKKETQGATSSPSNMPTVQPRNDGTDLWKSTLSGQPPAPKPQQPTSAWNHTPQNPTDYKNWGEDETDNAGAASNGPIGSQAPVAQNTATQNSAFGSSGQGNAPGRTEGNNFWGSDGSNGPQYSAPSKPKDDWGVPQNANNPGWGEPRRDGPGGAIGTRNGTDVNPVGRNDQGSWNTPAPIRPNGSGPTGNQWNSGIPPPSRGTGGWDHDSPPISRRDDGTSYWGREKPPGAPGAPPVGGSMGGVSGWKDMPTPNNMGMRGPPGPPGPAGPRMPPGKDPWGQPPTRPWGEQSDVNPGGAGPIGSTPSNIGWGDADLLKRDSTTTGWGETPRNASQWNSGQRNVNPPLRGSPDWEGPPGNSGMDMPGQGGSSGWNNPIKPVGPKKPTPEMIWASKQFRMLCEMGCSKTDAEAALKSTNLNLEDALEMLKTHGRLPMGGPSPWSEPPIGPPGNDFSNNPYNKGPNSFRGPNLGPNGQGGFGSQDMLGVNNQPNMPGNQNMSNNYSHMPLMGKQPNGMPPGPNNPGLSAPVGPPLGPPGVRPPTGGPSGSNQPSAQQLKLLVQQIQMAVQAGHLNPQILNQPLAPQTLVLLNQLLQQIKNLTNHQNILNQQKSMGNSNNLLSVSVDITKTKQEIQNLQNQISAQQATYLKQTQGMPPMPPQQSGSSGLQGSDSQLPDMFGKLSLPTPNTNTSEAQGKSKFLPFINKDNFSNAPGTTGSTPNSSKSSTLGSNTWGNDTWGALSPNDPTSSTGWPDSSGQNSKPGGQSQNSNLQQPNNNSLTNPASSATNGIKDTDFGIPEFQPGKPWKGMQDPTEDPNLTPGSVMPTMESNALSKTSSSSSLAAASTTTSAASSSAAMDTFGINSTWSFGNNKNDPLTISTSSSSNTAKSEAMSGGTWGNGPITSAPTGGSVSGLNTSNLTPMGQDLWGKSAIGRTPPGLPGSNSNSSWPSSNGWSNGNNDSGNQSAWLLLKNVTPQIDGATLKTLCLQHGPLKDFKLYANQGLALVQYAASRESIKAQKALNNCPLGNTTIQAIAISDSDAINFLTNMGDRNQTLTPTRGNTPSSNGMISSASTLVGSSHGLAKTSSAGDMWGTNISSANSLFGSTSTTTGGSTSAVWGMHGTSDLLDQERTTPQLQPFIPSNLLGE